MELIKNTTAQIDFVENIHNYMNKQRFMLSYRGSISQSITKSILLMTEKKMDLEQEDSSVKKKVFGVMVECLQNICKPQTADKSKDAIVMIAKSNEHYIVYIGNVIASEKKEILSQKINEINLLPREELKEQHKILLSNNLNDSNNQAILGLIDIAKKTGNKIEFYFNDVSDTNSFFSLKTIIARAN